MQLPCVRYHLLQSGVSFRIAQSDANRRYTGTVNDDRQGEFNVLTGADKSWTWIASIHGLNLIRWNDCDPVLISNHCSTVDAVFFKL